MLCALGVVFRSGLVKNLESLVQMTGRAGRDGQPAECILFYSKADYSKAIFWRQGNRGGKGQTAPVALSQEEKQRKSVIGKGLDKMSVNDAHHTHARDGHLDTMVTSVCVHPAHPCGACAMCLCVRVCVQSSVCVLESLSSH
jgi:superfamily II DNA helicase RecQ